MKNQNGYAKNAIEWNVYMESITNKVESYITSELSKGTSTSNIKDGVYNILTKEKFDSKGFDYIYKSAKLANPNLTKEKFLKDFTKRRIDGKKKNLFDNIDNKATTDRLINRILKDVGIVTERADRINKISDKKLTDAQSLWNVKRTVETVGTRAKHLESDIINVKRGLRNTALFSNERKLLKNRLSYLEKQYKQEKASYKTLKKEHDQLIARKDFIPQSKFNSNYTKLLVKIETDLRTRQVSFEIRNAVKSSAGEPIKTTAKTEFASEIFKQELVDKAKLEDSLKNEQVLMAQYSLNPSRTWAGTDECDDYAEKDNGWGAGVYMADDVPSVPVHPNCGCEVTFFKMNKSEL